MTLYILVFRGELYRALTRQTHHFYLQLWKLGKENNIFYFAKSFCCFRLNKSVLETAETKQADSQLHFASKIIEIHLLVFENKLIEDAMLVLKKSKN